MIRMKRILLIAIVFFSIICIQVAQETHEITVDNTVVISNETDESFCRDFSPFLKKLSLEWIILKEKTLPDSVKEKNLIIIGGPDAEIVGDIVTDILSWKEERFFRNPGNYSVLEKENHWTDGKTIHLCCGYNRLLTKRAAEEGVSSLMKKAHDPEKWINYPLSVVSLRDPQAYTRALLKAREYITQLQFVPADEELPRDQLRIDVSADIPDSISSEQAQEDIKYLFYLLSHGYSGYGYFCTEGDFEKAKSNIFKELDSSPRWSPEEVSAVIHENLTFIHDGHFVVGYHRYYTHYDFWYATLELTKTNGEYFFVADGVAWKVLTINGDQPEKFMFPSLNADGNPVYRVGILSQSQPESLVLTGIHQPEQKEFVIHLERSSLEPEDIFSEDIVDGIPVITVRSFEDTHSDELEEFLQTATKYRGVPYLILDIRQNRGGNSVWPETWVHKFTSSHPEWGFISTEFMSKTILMGRANLSRMLLEQHPDARLYSSLGLYEEQVDYFEKKPLSPYWSEVKIPDIQLISNTTTVVVLVDRGVASSGEAFISYLQQVENIVFVGENSAGVGVFGDITLHQLPNSKLFVVLPCKLFLPLDLEHTEEKGFFPDLWIPADCALLYSMEAVKNGTITVREQATFRDFLESGLEKKERGDVRGALHDLYEAYQQLTAAGLARPDIIYEVDSTSLTLQGLEEEVTYACLYFIQEGDEALHQGQYEDALSNFSLVNTCWPTLHYSLPLLAGSEEYEKYAELGYVYTVPKVEEVIELCITKIDEEALNLKEKGDLEKSKEKYEFIITNLRDGRWNYEEDIKEYKSKKSDIEEIIRKRLIMELVIAGLCVVTLAVLVYRKRRVNPNREEM